MIHRIEPLDVRHPLDRRGFMICFFYHEKGIGR
jgi:hypothetical protein